MLAIGANDAHDVEGRARRLKFAVPAIVEKALITLIVLSNGREMRKEFRRRDCFECRFFGVERL